MFMSSIGITGVIGGPLSGAIMKALAGTYGMAGWQWMFIVEGVPSIVFGVVAYCYLNDGPRQANWLSASEKAIVIADLDAERAAQKGKSHHSFAAALRAPQFYVLVCFATALLASTGGIFFWLPTIIRNSGVRDVLNVGLLSAIPVIIGVPAQQLIAFCSDRSLERRWHASAPALISALGWGLLPFVARSPALSLAALTLTTVGTLGAMGPFWTMPSALLTGPARAGGIALITTLGGIGSFFSPWLVGWLSTTTGSLASGQFYYAGLMFLGAVILLLGVPAVRTPTNAAA